jgi:hypothetical protein
VPITHAYVSGISDGVDTTLVRPTNWNAPHVGGGVPTVDQDISADFSTASDSAWHDITGLTGIVLTAGTWLALVDIELTWSGNLGPVFRIWDGTTTYAQRGYITGAPPAAVSNHLDFHSKPFVLGGSATMAVQVFTDTAFTIVKVPTRGAISSSVATHVTFMQVA